MLACFTHITTFSRSDFWPPKNTQYFDWENWNTFEVYSDRDRKNFRTSAAEPKTDFSTARSKLDYSYHLPPAEARQELQDFILSRVVDSSSSDSEEAKPACSTVKPSKPWIVFSAGAMGVGKGYVLSSLYNSKLFPLDKFLIIDPDMLKNELPEMSGYLQADPSTAATKVHRESTQMADVLLEFALSKKVPILVDGSLRDVDYYKGLFEKISKEFGYRIGIILVTAEPSTIHDRANQRAEKTGRAVPEDLINESIEQAPASVEQLAPYADVVFEIANDDDAPLRLVSRGDEKTTWTDFSNTWTDDDKKKTCALKQSLCNQWKGMSSCWDNSEAHDTARRIWGTAYPSFCPRCTLVGDGQCGVCVHGRHLCACKECGEGCSIRKALLQRTPSCPLKKSRQDSTKQQRKANSERSFK